MTINPYAMHKQDKADGVPSTDYGYLRVAAMVPPVNVADVRGNVAALIDSLSQAVSAGASVVVFPELCVTGYTCADLLSNDLLLDAAEQTVVQLADALSALSPTVVAVVGAPLRHEGHLLNCAVVMQGGELWVVPKTYIPNYHEFYERRWFASGASFVGEDCHMMVAGRRVTMGCDLLFDMGRACLAVEVCEDLWVPVPPSSLAAINGANVLLNLSASNELVGKHDYRQQLIAHQSAACLAAYVYASSGRGESTTDLVFTGHTLVAENGKLLAELGNEDVASGLCMADVDILALDHERRVNGSFADSLLQHHRCYRHIKLRGPISLDYEHSELLRPLAKWPFVPSDDERLATRCQQIMRLQAEGLMRRLSFTGIGATVVGVSGGLDSTLALLVAVLAYDRLGRSRKDIHAITMPGFGTTGRTHANACAMVEALGVTLHEISIAAAVMQHFKDLGHDPTVHDVTYENSQARERTQLLMDYANQVNGLVLGTGDLSELALGWATYNGDHMSMYNVNVSIPKTLVRHLVRWFANQQTDASPNGLSIRDTLLDVLDTPISPELTPASPNGSIAQVTEDLVGPYELHDFFLYHMLRYGTSPRKLYLLARKAFGDNYDDEVIKKWLRTFVKRFFAQQFKRSCLPDGPKVGSVSLSPRGDWRMPSDACAQLWLAQCDAL